MVRVEVPCELGWVTIVLRLFAIESKRSTIDQGGKAETRCDWSQEREDKGVRYLNEVILRPFIVHTGARRVPHKIAE